MADETEMFFKRLKASTLSPIKVMEAPAERRQEEQLVGLWKLTMQIPS